MPGNKLVQALGRGLDLLQLLATVDGGRRLTDLAAITGLKRPTLHNLLRTLVDRDFVIQDRGMYRLGPAIHLLASATASSALLRQAEKAVRWLAARLPEAIISFCEPVGSEVLVRFHHYPSRTLIPRTSNPLYSPYHTASGLAFLAYADPEIRQNVQMRHPFESEAISVWQTEARLEKFLQEVRTKGYVLPPFCAHSKFRLAAWPNLSDNGKLLGVLGAAWHVAPDAVTDGAAEVVAALREAAKRIPATGEICP